MAIGFPIGKVYLWDFPWLQGFGFEIVSPWLAPIEIPIATVKTVVMGFPIVARTVGDFLVGSSGGPFDQTLTFGQNQGGASSFWILGIPEF